MDFSHPALIQIFGHPGSGKTTLMRYMLLWRLMLNSFDVVYIFTGTHYDTEWDMFSPATKKIVIIDKEWDTALRAILDAQAATPGQKALLFIDDYTGKLSWKGGVWEELVTDFRHANTTAVIASHYVYKLTPLVRESATNAAFFQQQSSRSVNALYESFGQMAFDREDDFRKYLSQCTQDHAFIWYDRKKVGNGTAFQPMKVKFPIPEFKIK
jgi:adenylate kinase family enzyme